MSRWRRVFVKELCAELNVNGVTWRHQCGHRTELEPSSKAAPRQTVQAAEPSAY